MSSEKEIKNIPGLPAEESVIIRKIGYGSLNKLRNKATDTNMGVDGSIQSKMKLGDYLKWMLIYGVKKASFFDNCKDVIARERAFDNDVISAETGDFLVKKIQEFNKFAKIDDLKKE